MSQLRLIKTNELIINENEKLGEGEFGAVYAGKYILTDYHNKKFPVAIKVINRTKNDNPDIEKVCYFVK
uniref:Serine-threonine/tyrosine-protein kinase catalytic domain-containing protein n=1 Tax=Acrobeloides nanus TaxID=290746 RepID=A0A914DVF2_9BILA